MTIFEVLTLLDWGNDIQNRFFWYGMGKHIITYVSECGNCQNAKKQDTSSKSIITKHMNSNR